MRPIPVLLSASFLAMQFVPGVPQPGTVAGRIQARTTPPQQVASRYPSPGGQVQKKIDPMPTVVFIEGRVPGAPAWPRLSKPTIIQKDLLFSPSLLVIPAGTSISFPNEDNEFHNVFSYSKSKRFDLGRYPKGESKSVVFDKPGIVKIYCEVHPWMRAAILVLENPFYAIASADGTFSIQGIPSGHYDLVAWNIDAGSKKYEVDVPAQKAPQLLIQLTGEFQSGITGQDMLLDTLDAKISRHPDAIHEGACCAAKR